MASSVTPLVSVIITAYNKGWCIDQTILSVLRQTYGHMEIIVVDDASTDDTGVKVSAFGGLVTYIRHPKNRGRRSGAPARNTGIQHAKGELIALLDGDDLWEPDKLAVQVDAARRHPDSGLIAVDGLRFDDRDGRILNETLFVNLAVPKDGEVTGSLYGCMLHTCVIETPSQIVIPRRVIETVGTFADIPADDYDFLLRVSRRFPLTLIGKRLTKWRYRETNRSGPIERQQFRWIANITEVQKRHLALVEEQHRGEMGRFIQWELSMTAHAALEYGRQGRRLWASRYLLKVGLRNLQSPIAPSLWYLLVRLWCPRWISRAVQRLRRAGARS